MKLTYYLLAAGVVSLCACTTVPSPTAPTASVLAGDALASTTGFEPDFFRAFVQNAFESPNRLEPIRTLPGPLRIYMKTEDDAGRAIDPVTLATTERALIDSALIWSGEKFGVSEIVRGSGTREKTTGWLTVKWSGAFVDRCGRSTVGVDGGYLEFNTSGSCSCGLATRVYPRVVRHELGHAMGYYHTDDAADVMSAAPVSPATCDALPSDRERRHARFAYQPR